MVDMQAVADAAKARVVYWEDRSSGGLDVRRRSASLLNEMGANLAVGHVQWWQLWAADSFFFKLDSVRQEFTGRQPRSSFHREDLAKKDGW